MGIPVGSGPPDADRTRQADEPPHRPADDTLESPLGGRRAPFVGGEHRMQRPVGVGTPASPPNQRPEPTRICRSSTRTIRMNITPIAATSPNISATK
jgi:hypothetical protein